MEINYLILTHKNSEQLARLISKLQAPNVNFFIHLDKNEEETPFKSLLRSFQNIHFLPIHLRKKIIWGDISMIEATLQLMQEALKNDAKGYFVLLSGQDYPLKSNDQIQEFFKLNYGKCYISSFKLPHPGWENGGLNRINRYKINKSPQRKHFMWLPSIFDSDFYHIQILGKLNFLRKSGNWKSLFLIFRKRKHPKYIAAYGGGQWWAFPEEIAERIINFHQSHPEYFKYHRYTLAPDELFFHSILMHLLKEKGFPIGRSLTYVNWKRGTGPLPVTFESQDFEELKKASGKHLFARKFDLEKDQEIMDRIDKELL